MIQVEYSFCRIRLPAIGLMLPWQLVAAHEPGPMYFIGSEPVSAFAETEDAAAAEAESFGLERAASRAVPSSADAFPKAGASGETQAAHSTAASQQVLWAIFIQNAGRVCRFIIVGVAGKSTMRRCLFRSVARKGNGLLFTGRQCASSMQENPNLTLRR